MRYRSLEEAFAATEPVTELWLGDKPVKLTGIERLTSIQSITLAALDAAACARLAELPDLTTLQLNSALEVSAAITKLKSLRVVKLVFCDALDLADALPKLAKLRTLDTLEIKMHGSMSRGIPQPGIALPDVFGRFTQLRELAMQDGLHPFPPSIGSMTNLEVLSLPVNAFESIPKTIGKLQNLRVLELTSTTITKLPDELCECTQLESLGLLNCRKLAELPRDLGRLTSLRFLTIARTRIKALPASAAELTELRQFHASENQRLAVPAGFMADGADELTGPPDLLATIAMRPTETAGEDWVSIADPDRIPKSFGDPRTLEVRLPNYKKPLPQLGKLRSLETLDLDVHDLDAAFAALVGSRALRELTISGDHRTLPPSIGKLSGLTHLTIWAPIKQLPTELGDLVDLQELIVGSTVKVPPSIGKLVALRRLQLDRDTQLPAELRGCIAIALLNVGASTNAELTTIGSLPALDELMLRCSAKVDLANLARPLAGRTLSRFRIEGEIESLPPEIAGVQIRRLELESSQIRTLPAEARDWPTLREVVVRTYHASQLKPSLPRGRWRKREYSSEALYTRTA
jgi:Leucine-rich repeat (LRR) protein